MQSLALPLSSTPSASHAGVLMRRLELAQRLEARCREGIRVNLLFDSFGSLGTSAAFFERLLAGQLEQVLTEGRASAHSIEAQRWAQRSLRRRWQEAVARRFEVLM